MKLKLSDRILVIALSYSLMSCTQRMAEQPKYLPYDPSHFFLDGLSMRPTISGTVPRGTLPSVQNMPPQRITRTLLERGRERFNIHCSPCHGESGDGRGLIVERGFVAPPTFHSKALRDARSQHFFDVVTNGYGAMYSYRSRVSPEDRWAIAFYIRALQFSQNANIDELPLEDRKKLEQENQ